MSKESKPRDRWSQVYSAASGRPADWCKSCGYYRVVNGEHRADCCIGGVNVQRCDCGATLTRPESLTAGECLECRLCQQNNEGEKS